MITIILPTRGRTSCLEITLNSIIDNADSKDNYEIIFGIDNDDYETISFLDTFFENKEINYKKIFFEPLGYKNLHKLQNRMFEESIGDLLWIYGNDVQIITKSWDSEILKYLDEFYLFIHLNREYSHWTFSFYPIVSRKWVEITGRFSNNSQTDLWLGHMAEDLDLIKKIDVTCHVFVPADGSQHDSENFYKNNYDEFLFDKEKIMEYTKKIDTKKSEYWFKK